jgi:NAD(P)-dependent dehydrogenase (short-subunit alcohol dehydrogenase family)
VFDELGTAINNRRGTPMTTEQKPIGSGFGAQTTGEEALGGRDLRGKVALVTGGHSGIGLETTRVLSKAGAAVVVGARDVEKARANLAKIRNAEVIPLDLASPSFIDSFADAFLKSNRPLDILIHNAGLSGPPLTRDERGYEIQFATNHLGHFQLTARLWNPLKKSGNARVVAYPFIGHSVAGMDFNDPNFNLRSYDKWVAYGQSKTATSLFAVEFDKRAQAYAVRAFAVHPGAVLTDLLRYMSDEELKVWGVYPENAFPKRREASRAWRLGQPRLFGAQRARSLMTKMAYIARTVTSRAWFRPMTIGQAVSGPTQLTRPHPRPFGD